MVDVAGQGVTVADPESRERAILVGAPPPDMARDTVERHLDELERLADTAGAEVCGRLVQRLSAPNPSTYIGRGKVVQLRDMLREYNATLAIFDEDLSPAQGVALEDRLRCRIIDRTELILDIFALRARTAEAKLQVEAAQLGYLRSRLTRMWTHLSREGGGIGARGPGEQQLETDRRLVDRRIARLRRKLEHIARSRCTQRKARLNHFQVTLVGYTNAGKSSLLRGMSGAEVFVEDRLFATVDSATRVCDLPGAGPVLLTDTVGFIRKLPHHLVASFRATLEEIGEADLVLHVIDASAPRWDEHKAAVEEPLAGVVPEETPVLYVFNKVDRLTHAEEEALRASTAALRWPRVLTSVMEPGGLKALREALQATMRERLETVRVRVPLSDGAVLAQAFREGEVIRREYGSEEVVLRARVPAYLAGQWRGRGLKVHTFPG